MIPNDTPDSPKPARVSRGVIWAAAAIIMFMTVNWGLTVARFQVNGLFSDQWNFCEPILRGDGPLTLFTWQHVPHRQGLAFVLTSWIWEWSGWDTRVEALWGVAWLVVGAIMMLAWKVRLTGRLGWGDLWMPLAALALRQFETVITVPNLSHSVFPLVLLLALAWLMAKPPRGRDWSAMGGIGLLAVFTGFGLFVGAALGWVAGLRVLQAGRARQWQQALGPAGALVWLVGALGWFLGDYKLNPGNAGGSFFHWPWWDYPRFVVVMVASRMDLTGGDVLVYGAGSVVLVLAIAAWAHASWRLGRDAEVNPAWATASLMLTMGLGYAVFTAIGRVHLGVWSGEVPRYTTLMVAVWLGLMAWAWGSRRALWRGAAVVLGWGMVVAPWGDLKEREIRDWPGTIGMGNASLVAIEQSNKGKIEWLSVWEETGDWQEAEGRVPKGLHGQPVEVGLARKIEFMRERRLSFAAEPERRWAWMPWWNPQGVTWARALGGLDQQWMEDEAVLIIDGRDDGFLNLRVAWKAPDLPEEAEIDLQLGPQRARLSYKELLAGVSVPAPRERVKLILRSVEGKAVLGAPTDMREGSFLVVEPTLTGEAIFERRGWVEGVEGLWSENSLVMRSGFYGWEENGAFGWTRARWEIGAHALQPHFVNVSIASRYGAVNEGPVRVSINGKTRELAWREGGLGFAIELRPGRTYEITVENIAGEMSPKALGRSEDARPLALRVDRLTMDLEPAYALLGEMGTAVDIPSE